MLTAKRPQTPQHRAALSASAKARTGAPHPPDNLPVTILRLELARARRCGVTFEDAWPEALDRAVSPCRADDDRKTWRIAFTETRGAWQRAWDREGTKCFGVLASVLIDVDCW